MTPTDMRASAANLWLLSDVYEGNAIASPSFKMAAAWDQAMLHLLDAATALNDAADELEGVWKLPLRRKRA